jgi:hypothetical protein
VSGDGETGLDWTGLEWNGGVFQSGGVGGYRMDIYIINEDVLDCHRPAWNVCGCVDVWVWDTQRVQVMRVSGRCNDDIRQCDLW